MPARQWASRVRASLTVDHRSTPSIFRRARLFVPQTTSFIIRIETFFWRWVLIKSHFIALCVDQRHLVAARPPPSRGVPERPARPARSAFIQTTRLLGKALMTLPGTKLRLSNYSNLIKDRVAIRRVAHKQPKTGVMISRFRGLKGYSHNERAESPHAASRHVPATPRAPRGLRAERLEFSLLYKATGKM
ncbi:hypothetical protein EVAR_50582_1 [Eumeta japonica]|uniref:Uncharacterized protein n=1 Tax=Eumeta variegata TaxID=151549 RepID=A0A4C1Y9H4_EUMVA|nr:hypothetical protein EVAR_50582_1 [Eumeta japonica]